MIELNRLLPLLVPVIIIQIALAIFALIDLSRQTRLRGPKWMWVLIIVFVNLIGPAIYFLFAKQEE